MDRDHQNVPQVVRGAAQAYMTRVVANLKGTPPGGSNDALSRAAWTLGRWVAASVLWQNDVEDGLYAAAERNGLVADDVSGRCGQRFAAGSAPG